MSYPTNDISITESQLRKILDAQFPEYASFEISLLTSGWDNMLFRLGDELIIRIPRRKLGAQLIEHEITWLPILEDLLPIRVPTPIKIGSATNEYPYKWTINPWFDGDRALEKKISANEVKRLVSCLRVLHSVDTTSAPSNPFRENPLIAKDKDVQLRINEIEAKSIAIPDSIKKLWDELKHIEIDVSPSLIHGDLHPGNIIMYQENIEAIIDWGDITKGDISTDLACFWMLIGDNELRFSAFDEYGASQSTLLRAKAWAIFYGITFLNAGTDYLKLGESILQNVIE